MDGNNGHGDLSLGDIAHSKLDRAKSGTMPLKLRETTTKTTELLGNLKTSLDSMSDFKRTKLWCEMIDQLQKKSGMPRTVIGVLGDTGSGKSSAINAVLDEERVVPTNCMRACTAVITEIAYNNSDDPDYKYCAEINFMTLAEWTQELLQLYRDLFDAEGKLLSTDIRNHDSEAGSAYATLRAVYPQLNDEELEQSHATALANHPNIKEVLGTKKYVADSNSDEFYIKIQSFVDSEENSSDTNGRSRERKMAFWPLIKVVRVFLKSEIVSTGVVLVDLPGGRDSNTTRAAVAAKYVKECTRLITFICTKADDIAIDEAADILGLKSDIKSKKKQLKILESQKIGHHAHYKAISTQFDNWQGIHRQAARRDRALTPYESPRKRKRRTRSLPAETTQLNGDVEASDSEETDDEDELAMEMDDSSDQREAVSAEDALAKINELKEIKKAMREQKHQFIEQIKQLKEMIEKLVAARAQIKVNMYRMCIQGQNLYSRGQIQKDFALVYASEYLSFNISRDQSIDLLIAIFRLDEELLAEQQSGEASQNIQESTDYEQIGEELAVFCISSRGYQQLRGRMRKDARVLGFTSLDDTGVPGLCNHTLSLTADIQAGYFKSHLNEIGRVLQGMDLFLAGDEATLKLSEAEREAECQFLKMTLKNLYRDLRKDMTKCMRDCSKAVQGTLVRAPQGASNASAKAIATVHSWGADYKAGGFRFPTYRATCRRRGIFKGSAGPRDFNEGLFDKQVAALAHMLEQATKENKRFVADNQKEANRLFSPVVAEAMRPAYDYCAQQRGAGCFFVIKDYMETHVDTQRTTMFKKAADKTTGAAELSGHDDSQRSQTNSAYRGAGLQHSHRNGGDRELIVALTLIEEEAAVPIAKIETELGGDGSDDE
ncbi:hypothetical protein CSAL01_09810 [Colletotrichum salicis]|uniref:Dynamin N-terminal domain-containing protein n=1 Tax=Colletotrichum salicis TaxID=1209931 RepID=A0A135UIB2_9PEZI|nr:hypothetical protein CSAL01_09810 [Colletotrichum salicis]